MRPDTLLSRRWARLVRYFAYCAAGIIVVIVAAAFILPEFLDRPAVRTAIQRKLSEIVQGEVAWDDLSIRILPSPRGVLRKARVEIPGSLDLGAEELAVRLAFWPLLRGRAEITSVRLSRPVIYLDVPAVPESRRGEGKGDADAEPDLAVTYRSTVGVIAGVVRRFAPDTELSIENGRMEFSAPGVLPIALHDVSVRARTGRSGMELDASLAGTHWSRVKLAARMQFADLSSNADIELTGFKPQPWLDRYLAKSPVRLAIPASDVRVQARIDAKTALDGNFDLHAEFIEFARGAQHVRIPDLRLRGKVAAGQGDVRVDLDDVHLGAGRLTGGTLRYSAARGAAAVAAGFDIDMAQAMDNTRRLVPATAGAVLAGFQPVTGRAQGSARLTAGHAGWNVGVEVLKSDTSVRIREIAEPVHIAGGAVEIDPDGVTVERAALAMPAGTALVRTLRYGFRESRATGAATFDIDLPRALEVVKGLLSANQREALDVIQSASGRTRGEARFAMGRGKWSVGVNVLESDSAVGLRGLPGPVGVAGGSVEVNPAIVKVDRVALTMLDARALVSGTLSGYRAGEMQATATISDGAAGERFLGWVWRIAQAPPRLALRAPVRVAAQRIAWSPQRELDVEATARFDAGPAIAVDLAWTPGALDIRRAAIKDGRSDAAVALRAKGGLLEGKFAGTLDAASIAAVLKDTRALSGNATGDLRFTYDHDSPRRATIEGHLKGESLDLAWLTGRPVEIARIDLATDDTTLRIREAAVSWAGQRATLRGQISRSEKGPVIDAQLDSAGIDLDALFPPTARTAAEARPGPAADGADATSRLWPLPVTGRIAVRSDFVRSGRHTVAPVAATLVLEERRARLDLKQAQLCGISLPLTLEATPQGFAASALITAQKQQLAQTAHCLTDSRVQITGLLDLKADISTQGKRGELAKNLKGTVNGGLRDGKVMKFALLGNILSMQNVSALFEKGGPKLDEAGFPYRTLTVAGHFEDGKFIVKESAFRSDAVGLVGTGWVSILDYQSRLSVLVAPFSRVDELVRRVPVLGYILGGTLTSLPVGVSGDIRDPLVVPLGPGAVTSEVLGIFERTLKLPARLIDLPSGGKEAKPPDGK